MAHVSDAESLAFHFSKPRPEYDAAFSVAVILQWAGIATIGHKDSRHRIRTLARFRDIELDRLSFLPHGNGAADRLSQQTVAKEHVVKPFFEQHVEGLAQREHKVLRWCASVFLVVRVPIARGPVPVGRSQTSLLVCLAGAITGGHEAEAGRRHQAFLRSRHGDVHAPSVHLERHAAQRSDGIDHKQSIMPGRLDDLADCSDIV